VLQVWLGHRAGSLPGLLAFLTARDNLGAGATACNQRDFPELERTLAIGDVQSLMVIEFGSRFDYING
jgi:hypothetical protein